MKLPPGLIGNPTSIPQCTTVQFFEAVESKANRCPASTAVGVATVTVHEPASIGTSTLTEPIFNLEPRPGELQFDWLTQSMDTLGRHGLKVIVGTPTATRS